MKFAIYPIKEPIINSILIVLELKGLVKAIPGKNHSKLKKGQVKKPAQCFA